MFPEAFPLPQEQGGTIPPAARPNSTPPRSPADVSTIRRSPPLFNWNLPRCLLPVDSSRRKVQTFLDSTAPPNTIPRFARSLPFITAWPSLRRVPVFSGHSGAPQRALRSWRTSWRRRFYAPFRRNGSLNGHALHYRQ